MSKIYPVPAAQGQVATYLVADPAAATDFTWSVPANSRALVVSGYFKFVTSATAGNRIVTLGYHDGTRMVARCWPANNQAEDLTYYYQLHIGVSVPYSGGNSNYKNCPLNPYFWLEAGESLQSQIDDILAGDQISDIYLRCRTWQLG
jgi:hypothetical protein